MHSHVFVHLAIPLEIVIEPLKYAKYYVWSAPEGAHCAVFL